MSIERTRIETLQEALAAIGRETQDGPITSCGISRDGKEWLGIGHHANDNGREVVAPARVYFLPVTLVTSKPS